LTLSEKHVTFSDMMPITEEQYSLDFRLSKRIFGSGRGWVFTPSHFLDLGSRDAVDQALSRLAANGTIRRLARGVYDYPKVHDILGVLLPKPDTVAKAIAARDAARLQPAGAYAANLLGLSEQVPADIVFLTDGLARTVQVGPTTITLRRTTPRNMAMAGKLSGLLVQALRNLGQAQVSDEVVARLRQTLPFAERQGILRDIKLVPAWMHPVFRALGK
jgi:hypothetical protein